ncbi:hypothetical protein Tco_0551679 [Tanacetum coccineum]
MSSSIALERSRQLIRALDRVAPEVEKVMDHIWRNDSRSRILEIILTAISMTSISVRRNSCNLEDISTFGQE